MIISEHIVEVLISLEIILPKVSVFLRESENLINIVYLF